MQKTANLPGGTCARIRGKSQVSRAVTKTLLPAMATCRGSAGVVNRTIEKAMKLILFFLTAAFLNVSAAGNAQSVTFSGERVPLKTVFSVIEKQTGFVVFYNRNDLEQTVPVSVKVDKMPLADLLSVIFKGQPLAFKIVDKTIILSEKKAVPLVLPEQSSASETLFLPVTGRVLSPGGEPLQGVSIKIKGATKGTVSDKNGQFSINAMPDEVLVFSYIGMQAVEVIVKAEKKDLVIVMKATDASMKEVVVTGYGNINKESFTGTYTQVTKEELLKVSPNNLIAALQVFDPSFRIIQNIEMGSNPNMLPEFYIRGQSGFPGVKELDKIQSGTSVSEFSLKNNPNTPIFIMDGFEVSVEKVYDLDINRVANVTILKDAAATAIYGSRASNGVLVIETISPKPGQLRVNYSGTYSVTAPDLSSYNMMNAQEKVDAEMAAKVYLPNVPETSPTYNQTYAQNLWYMQQKRNEVLKGVNTYWLSQPLSTMFNNKHNVFIEGGSEGMRIGLELKYDNQNGVMKESLRKRLGAGLTMQYQTRALQFRNQVFFDDVRADDSPFGKFSDYSRLQPYYSLTDEHTGKMVKTFPPYGGSTRKNPLYEATVGNFSKNRYKEFTDNFMANWYINNFLFLRAQFAIDYKDANGDVFISPSSTSYERVDLFNKGDLRQSTTTTLDWNTNVFASYNRNIDANNINISAGINAKATKEEYVTSAYRGFPSPAYHSPAYASQIVAKPTLNDNKKRLLGGFATINYSLHDIYLFDGSFRVDGSSEFGTDKQWAPFWSVGTGINLHKTKYFKEKPKVDIFRVTANIGQTGKSNFSPFMARNTYQMMLDDWYPTGIGAGLIYMGNKNLTWEKQISWNIGTMVTLLKQYTFEFNYYNKQTYDLITDVSLPSSAGFNIYRDNIGKVRNKGFEFKTTLNVLNTRDASLILNGNLAHNKNSIIEIAQSMKRYNSRIDDYYGGYLNNPNPALWYERNQKFTRPIMKYEEGSSLTTIYGMRSLGINPANGKEVYLNRDGTATYDWNALEQQAIGNTEPWAQGAFGINGRYKRFSLYTTFLYGFGGEQYNNTLVNNVENVNLLLNNADRRVLSERWQKPGDITPLKGIDDRLRITRPTSRFVQKNNYVSFNSMTLGYSVDPARLKLYKLSVLRVSLMMNDIAMFSSIRREMGLEYPYARTFTFTINVSF